MLGVTLICVGKMRERYFIEAFSEYTKRLNGFCRLSVTEIAEQRLPENPSEKEIAAALEKEAKEILDAAPPGAYTAALCVEGKTLSSEELAGLIRQRESSGRPKVCFIVGGSFGLADRVKQQCDVRISMSAMTFPHHLARVMLAEQIYRAFQINGGTKYHK